MYSETPMMSVPKLTLVNKSLLIASGVMFLLQSILGSQGIRLEFLLGLSGAKFFGGHIYELLTYSFVGSGFIEVLFNGLIIWFIGSELEAFWGQKSYTFFLIVSILGSGLIYGVISFLWWPTIPLLGLSVICFMLLMSYSLLYPDRILLFMMLFPMKAKYFCWILLGMELYLAFFSPYRLSSVGHIMGLCFGYSYVRHSSFWSNLWSKLSKKGGPRRKASSANASERGGGAGSGHLRLVEREDEAKENGKNQQRPKYWQ